MARIRSKYDFHCIFIIQNCSFFYKCLYRSRKTAAMHTGIRPYPQAPVHSLPAQGNRLTDRIMTDIYILKIFIRRSPDSFTSFKKRFQSPARRALTSFTTRSSSAKKCMARSTARSPDSLQQNRKCRIKIFFFNLTQYIFSQKCAANLLHFYGNLCIFVCQSCMRPFRIHNTQCQSCFFKIRINFFYLRFSSFSKSI